MNAVAICSGKGSPGATFVAVNLAAALARDREVMLLDCDPSGGDLAAYLGLDPRRGLYPLLQMDSSSPDAATLMHEAEERAGFATVCGFPDACTGSSVWKIPEVVRAARRTERFVMVDLGRVSERTPVLAAEADVLVLVVRPDLVSVAGAERALRQLASREFPLDRVRAVVSGVERKRPGDVAEVSSALGVPVLGSLPFDRRETRKAMVSQTPVTKGRLARAFAELATAVTTEAVETREKAGVAS